MPGCAWPQTANAWRWRTTPADPPGVVSISSGAALELGAVSALDVHQAETLLQTARADAARFETVVAQDRNVLAQLVGGGVPGTLLPDGLEQAVATVAGAPPGALRGAHAPPRHRAGRTYALLAANASIGAARSLLPRITLTATAGTASSTLDGLFDGGSGAWSFVPQLRLPIFEAGRLQASLDLAEIQRDINVAQYEKAIQSAFREVADALAERATVAERIDARRKQVAATQNSLKLSDARYRGGVDSYLNLLDAQRSLYAAELELIGVRLIGRPTASNSTRRSAAAGSDRPSHPPRSGRP